MNKKINRVFIILFFLWLPFFLEAQTADSGAKTRSIRLPWPRDDNAWSYEVLIEVEAKRKYSSYSQESTHDPFIVVSLPPGRYRYRVIPYNFLGQPEIKQSSAWRKFVIPAASPKTNETLEPIFLSDIDSSSAQPESDESTAVTINQLTAGASLGTSFYRPWLITTFYGTYAPLPNSFLKAGIDLGMVSGDRDASYFSFYHFVHYNYSRPMPFLIKKASWYIGGGGGYWMSNYSASGETARENKLIFDFIAGINIINMFDVSYTLRTDLRGVNHKLSAGYVYRFKKGLAVDKQQEKGETNEQKN